MMFAVGGKVRLGLIVDWLAWAFWQWEREVQLAWAEVVRAVGEQCDTPMDVQLRMMRLGFRWLRVLTWPQSLVRRLEYLAWLAQRALRKRRLLSRLRARPR